MIKRLILSLALAAGACATGWSQSQITFDGARSHDFGNVRQDGGNVSHVFEFTNTGDKPLVIIDAKASCGCTQPKYPQEPIKPGERGSIRVTFVPGAQGPGEFHKTVKVRTNAPKGKKVVLAIKGAVIPK